MLIQDLVIVLFMAEHGDLMYDYKHCYILDIIHCAVFSLD